MPHPGAAHGHVWLQVHPAHSHGSRGAHPPVAKSPGPNRCAGGYLWLQLVRYCQLLSHACVWRRNAHTLCSVCPRRRHGQDVGYCLLLLPRSCGSVHWNYFIGIYRLIFRLGDFSPRLGFVGCIEGIILTPVWKSVLSCHRIPEVLVLGKSLSKSDDTVSSGKSSLRWDTAEEGTLISCLHLIRLVDI